MSKTIKRTACFYLPHEDVRRLDEIRGIISRSKIGAIAVRRLIADVETGKMVLPSEIMTTKKKNNSGVMDFPKATTNTTYTYSITPTSIGVPKTTEGLSSVDSSTIS